MTERARRSKAVLLVALLVVAGGLASVVLLANGNRNLNRLLIGLGLPPVASRLPVERDESEPAVAAKPPKPIIYIPERMMDPPSAAPQEAFRRTITRRREDICAALQKGGWVGEEWQAGDVTQQDWSCGAESVVADRDGSNSPAGSLFVSARGRGSDRVSSVRLKINFLNGELSAVVLERAVSAASDILRAIGWGDDPEIMQNMRQLKAFKIKGNGNRISLSREQTDIPRYNFLIVSDPPGLVEKDRKPADRKKWLDSPAPEK